jgi:hypothetical protein
MRRVWMFLTLAMLFVLVLGACGGKTAAPPTTEPVAAPTRASQQPEPTVAPQATEEMAEPTEVAEPTEAVEPTAESAPSQSTESDLSLQDRTVGLDQLKSYRVNWQANWESTADGTTHQTTWGWMEEYTSEPQALHYVWKTTEDGVDKGGLDWWQVGDTMYMLSTAEDGTTSCASFSSSDPEAGLQKGAFSPSMLGGVSGAKYVGTETVNGIATRHYQYDQSTANLLGFGNVSGETWVATDGGYVVKDTVSWEGGPGLFGAGATEGESGKGSWDWELTDPNGAFTIIPPEGCESAAKGLPVMPDASNKTTMGDLTMYQTASKAADVVAFYQKEMAAAGWQQSGEPTSMEGFATVGFSKDGQQASVTITSEGEGSQVMISVSKSQ